MLIKIKMRQPEGTKVMVKVRRPQWQEFLSY